MNNQELGPIFDSNGDYNPERAKEEMQEQERFLSDDINLSELNLPDLDKPVDANDLSLPGDLSGINASNIESDSNHLVLPEKVGENLDLRSLKSADDLKFPDDLSGLNIQPLSMYEAEKMVEQMENGTMSVNGELIDNSMDLPGNVIK